MVQKKQNSIKKPLIVQSSNQTRMIIMLLVAYSVGLFLILWPFLFAKGSFYPSCIAADFFGVSSSYSIQSFLYLIHFPTALIGGLSMVWASLYAVNRFSTRNAVLSIIGVIGVLILLFMVYVVTHLNFSHTLCEDYPKNQVIDLGTAWLQLLKR